MNQSTDAAEYTLRPALNVDRQSIETLVAHAFATTRFAEVATYALRAAFERATTEAQAIVTEHGGTIVGFALFGDVAGTIGTGRIHCIGVSTAHQRRGAGSRMCEAAVSALAGRGARSVVAEFPDHSLFAGGRTFLERCGFVAETRVLEYYGDGVDLLVLQRATNAR